MKFSNAKNSSFQYAIFTIIILYFLFCMIIQPAKFINQSLNGISAWAYNVLPSVLPFMFFTKVLSSLDFLPKLTRPLSGFTQNLFKTPPISIYTFIMAILSGYPVGSKMVADLYLQGKITKEEAYKMTSFCSTSGPMFIIGAVGVGMFKSSTIGYILFLSHLIGAILNGILYRNYKLKKEETNIDFSNNLNSTKQSFNLSEIVLNSTLSILSVGCIITIFFIVIECLSPIFSLFPTEISYFLEGMIEITKGSIDLSSLTNKFLAICLCSFTISFGGISTILQSITMLTNLKMPVKIFALQKFTHACFSLIITIILLLIFPL